MIEAHPAKQQIERRITGLRRIVALFLLTGLGAGTSAAFWATSFTPEALLALAGGFSLIFCGATVALCRARARLEAYRTAERDIATALRSASPNEISGLSSRLETAATRDSAIRDLYAQFASSVDARLETAREAEVLEARHAKVAALCADARSLLIGRIEQRRLASPAVRAERMITDAIETLKSQKLAAEKQLDAQRERRALKWWFDLTKPGFEEVDAKVEELEAARRRLSTSRALEKTEEHYEELALLVERRTIEIERAARSAIPSQRHESFDAQRIVQNAMLLSAFSIPVSAWQDFSQAGEIFDSLREVNGNYADMSDTEIWLDTLTMAGPELAGLANLTKGALFEKHVEASFGGERFEHFNHPDTDILIDGVAYQVKATDSVSYIESVPDDIPVISTSEIADITGSVDGGLANEELTDALDLALGGTVVDIGDTTVDAVLAGVGGIGIFAILRGVQSAAAKYKESGDALEASVEGFGATAVGTTRSAVNLAEIATKSAIGVLKSTPMRLAGGLVVSGVRRFDRWIERPEEEQSETNTPSLSPPDLKGRGRN